MPVASVPRLVPDVDALARTFSGPVDTMTCCPMVKRVETGVAACVVAFALADCAEVLPAASYAETEYEYEVPAESPVSLYEAVVAVPV